MQRGPLQLCNVNAEGHRVKKLLGALNELQNIIKHAFSRPSLFPRKYKSCKMQAFLKAGEPLDPDRKYKAEML